MHPLALSPFLLLLAILPFPGTVTLRLLCLAAAFLIAAWSRRRFAPPPVPLSLKVPLALWTALALISLSYAADPAYSLGEIKNEVLYAMMTFAAFFAATREDEDLKRLMIALFSGALLICLWALVQRYRLGVWIEAGRYGGTAAFAGYALMLVPMLLLWFCSVGGKWRWAAPVLFGIVIVTAFFTLQRIVWPVLFIEALLALVLLRRCGMLKISQTALLGLCVAGMLTVAAAMIAVKSERFKSNDPAAVLSEDSRLAQWQEVAGRIAASPLSGGGFGRGALSKAYRDLIPKDNTLLWHAHNVFLNYGLEMGLPGVLAILAVFGALLIEYSRLVRSADDRLKLLGIAGIMLVIGVVGRNQVNDMFVREQAILFWALNGALLGLGQRKLLQTAARPAA